MVLSSRQCLGSEEGGSSLRYLLWHWVHDACCGLKMVSPCQDFRTYERSVFLIGMWFDHLGNRMWLLVIPTKSQTRVQEPSSPLAGEGNSALRGGPGWPGPAAPHPVGGAGPGLAMPRAPSAAGAGGCTWDLTALSRSDLSRSEFHSSLPPLPPSCLGLGVCRSQEREEDLGRFNHFLATWNL